MTAPIMTKPVSPTITNQNLLFWCSASFSYFSDSVFEVIVSVLSLSRVLVLLLASSASEVLEEAFSSALAGSLALVLSEVSAAGFYYSVLVSDVSVEEVFDG